MGKYPSLSSILLYKKRLKRKKSPFELDGFINGPVCLNPNDNFTFAGIIQHLKTNHNHNNNDIIVIILLITHYQAYF